MALEKYVVSNDKSIYEAWPDIVKTKSGKLVCVFSECKHHGDRDQARIVYKESLDKGKTWSDKTALTEKSTSDNYYNCARISKLPDDTLVIIADYVIKNESHNAKTYLWKSIDDGKTWKGPFDTPSQGIVPDKLLVLKSGRWILSSHFLDISINKLVQYLWYSDDSGITWSDRITVAKDEKYNLCEASILEVEDNVLIAFLRENSWEGYDCFKAFSYDGGETWDGVYKIPIPGCHRPVTGFLSDGRILMTYRFIQGGKQGWGRTTQNFMGCIFDKQTALEKERRQQQTRIFPIDYDRNPKADLGYSGWVQFEDGTIYVVNYLLDDEPKGQIRGYTFKIEDFLFSE
ncbi:MAG: sialidase family protein [Clostridia bacterium]|jgi:sialidase-1|nr:sialidase family protein [Clostridia bacterium]MDD3971826.1 sialidase family protein [Clostridia bacterium]NLF37041.1 exo-alpha-sialidase [Clostridiaceae bacterium]HXK72433.1 sialidase family protein [Clostridia bacterium]